MKVYSLENGRGYKSKDEEDLGWIDKLPEDIENRGLKGLKSLI